MTTMADYDIGALGITAEPENIQPDEYVAPGADFEPIPAGTYLVAFADGKFKADDEKLPIRPGKATLKKNGKTYLSCEYAVQIAEGKFEGRIIYGRVNTIPEGLVFNKVKPGRENATGFLDLLMAGGSKLSANPDSSEYLNALDTLVADGALVKASIDWEAYSSPTAKDYAGTGERMKGMKNFPLDSNGQPNPRVEMVNAGGEGTHTVLAKNIIKGVYPSKR